MSYMEIYAVLPNGDVTPYGEAHNAFGGAMHIWLKLAQKYAIPVDFSETGFNQLWASISLMLVYEQWVMASTFDRFIVPKAYLPDLIAAWKCFTEQYPSQTLQKAIAILERANTDALVQGVAFNHTSVVETWAVPEDEDDGSRLYNVNTDTGHTYLTPEYLAERSKETA